jgi:N-acetylmuramoyl-L-alanine amidase
MKRTLVLFALTFTTFAAAPTALAEPPAVKPARTMYADVLERERAVRAALAAPNALATILIEIRPVVAAYESIVKQYPVSSYSDVALWNAARLSLDAYAKFNQAADKDSAVRLFNKLATSYRTSKFAKQVPEQLARIQDVSPERTALPAVEISPKASGPTIAATVPPVTPGVSPASTPLVAQAVRPSTPQPKVLTIRDIRRTVTPQAVRITIELDGEPSFHDERIADPERVFVDLASTKAAPSLVDKTIRFESDDDVVRQVRIGRHPNNTTRVVLDADGIGSYSVYPMYVPYRLVIDCAKAQTVKLPAEPPAIPSRKLTTEWVKAYPNVSPRATARIADAVESMLPAPTPMTAAPTAPTLPTATPTTPPAKSAAGGVSMARQLGLGVSRIVIDPGHGGHDPGAKGRGVTEAELVLDVSLRLQKLLEKSGMEVILTRTADDFVPLQERPQIANRENADLFLSIHANASPVSTARGIETYFLNFASNPNAAQVAARENAVSALSMGTLPDMVKAIALNNKVDESKDFAGHVQHAMVDRLRTSNKTLKDLGVKQAPFIVLIGATMPSVLAEISFVTNPQEARLLKSNAYRQKIADALFNAIRKYQTSLKTVQTVAHQ